MEHSTYGCPGIPQKKHYCELSQNTFKGRNGTTMMQYFGTYCMVGTHNGPDAEMEHAAAFGKLVGKSRCLQHRSTINNI